MKNEKDIMHVIERVNKRGELSFELHCSGKDQLTRKNKVYVHTVKLPAHLKGKKEIAAFRLECQLQWKQEVQKKAAGATVEKSNILFIDFAREWTENILRHDRQAISYYRTSKARLPLLEEKLGGYLLQELTPKIIQDFCYWLCERTYEKKVITVTESLKPLIKERKISLCKVAQGCKIANATLFVALTVGEKVSKETAATLCEFLGVPFKKYFDEQKQKISYSYSHNNGFKVMIHSVLHEAVRLRLIEHNVASKDNIRAIKGKNGIKEIFDKDEDILEFQKCIEAEPDIRKKVAFSIYINLGLRNCELSGLEWGDINFDTSEITIQRNNLYLGKEFGMVTKTTKTKKSNRTITIPHHLFCLLKEYKTYWDEQKINHGDLWANTDRLFCQNSGKDMAGITIANWLKTFEARNGLKNVTPHGLRHTNVTWLLKSGIDVKTVSERVGHADVSTTLNIYSHFTKEADRQAANKLDELLSVR